MAEKKKKTTKWIQPQHKIVVPILRELFRPIALWLYHLKVVRFKEENGRQYLILANHQTGFDQFFPSFVFKQHRKSPLELFTAKIEEEIKNGYSIYIASDDIDLKKELTKQYGPSIIMQPLDCVTRNSHEGIEEAMIDMLCLAMSKKIYGSFGSTFSSVASYIYGAPLEILQI